MSKYKIMLIVFSVALFFLGIFVFLWFTGLFFAIIPFITNSGWCASLGVERLSDHDLNQLQNNSETEIRFLQIIEEEMKTLPKLKQVIDKVRDRVEFNTSSWIKLSQPEMQTYYDFLAEKFKQQYKTDMEKNSFLWINYDNKTYVINNFVFTDMSYDTPHYVGLRVELDPYTKVPMAIAVTDDDFRSIPGIKKAIDEIGTYETSPFSNIGLPEDEQRRYMDWFKEKFEEQYGAQADGSYSSYFQYNGKYYAPNFSIC